MFRLVSDVTVQTGLILQEERVECLQRGLSGVKGNSYIKNHARSEELPLRLCDQIL